MLLNVRFGFLMMQILRIAALYVRFAVGASHDSFWPNSLTRMLRLAPLSVLECQRGFDNFQDFDVLKALVSCQIFRVPIISGVKLPLAVRLTSWLSALPDRFTPLSAVSAAGAGSVPGMKASIQWRARADLSSLPSQGKSRFHRHERTAAVRHCGGPVLPCW